MAANDDQRRVELTPRQIRDMEALIDTARSESATEEERAGADAQLRGYVRSALNRRS
jgi:hypothetical protein